MAERGCLKLVVEIWHEVGRKLDVNVGFLLVVMPCDERSEGQECILRSGGL